MIKIVTATQVGADAAARPLPFYLAMEEWVARTLPPAEYFFVWRVRPTVIFGRNQDARAEVDLEYCREHGIAVTRRRSGGGCVYADLDNLMISYITPATDVTSTFTSYTGRIASLLRELGLDAEANGRNDVLIGGSKVSGNAFYHLPGRSIVHGTLLYDADIDTMSRAITPSRSKLQSHSVQSVQSRITSVSKHLPGLTIDKLVEHIESSLADGRYTPTDAEIRQIEQIEQRYHDLRWTFGNRGVLSSPKDLRRIRRRIPGVGELDITITLAGGRIDGMDITGDYFPVSDIDSMLIDPLKGCRPCRDDIARTLAATDLTKVIAGLETGAFIELFN